ncbi:hypothetical protein FO519_006017 [Halicephalobus sp. NKZ332]|nr:hypothetical protein FO519_006017 [Halicephalobus sp. NKZ332]
MMNEKDENIAICFQTKPEAKLFEIKKWNPVALWTWDVECDICAICRMGIMESCMRCQSDSKAAECVVIWGECGHSFHHCCMSLWVKQSKRCPLCQQIHTMFTEEFIDEFIGESAEYE